jgi:5-methylcytosine-specific restriction protein A
MSSDSTRSKYKYGDKPGWEHVVETVEALGGRATRRQVDDHLKRTFPNWQDDTNANLLACSVNYDYRANWSYNREPRRADDEGNPHHQYDRLYKVGFGKNVAYELYQPDRHGIWELYQTGDGKWRSRQVGRDEAHQVQMDFEADVQAAIELTAKERNIRLAAAEKHPKTQMVTTTVFIRNPYVVAEVLHRAQGKCEKCGHEAPFLRAKDGTPYLEVHHQILLSEGGEDTVENAIALCPNCHRQVHFG